jgi:hypothetical protein
VPVFSVKQETPQGDRVTDRLARADMSFPPQPPSGRSAVQSDLKRLRDWGTGSAATAIVMVALLPFAVLWHAGDLVAITASLIIAATIAAACHFAGRHRLATLAMFPQFARLPELARTRRRLLRPRTRRHLARWLRRTAAIAQPLHPFDRCPVLVDRVAAVRPALLELADALQHNPHVDPTSVALLHELLANGCCSPLYNPDVPAEELHATLTRVHAGIVARHQPVGRIGDRRCESTVISR